MMERTACFLEKETGGLKKRGIRDRERRIE